MIGMLVGDQDPVNLISLDLQLFQAFLYSLFTDPCIYKQMRAVAPDVDTVAAASAGDTAQSHSLSPICLSVFSNAPLLSMITLHALRNSWSEGWDAIMAVIFPSV